MAASVQIQVKMVNSLAQSKTRTYSEVNPGYSGGLVENDLAIVSQFDAVGRAIAGCTTNTYSDSFGNTKTSINDAMAEHIQP